MKINKAVTETVINYIHLTFEKKHPDLGEFKVFLIASGISKQEAVRFIKEKCKHKIDYQKIEEEMASSDEFFLNIATNLLPYLEKIKREMFKQIMKRFGYILGVNKQFKKGTKPELVNYDKTKTIKKIEIYKDETRHRFRIAVNDKLIPWTSPHGNTDKHYWDYIHEIAQEGQSEIIYAGKAAGIEQWFNSKKDNPIYKKSGLRPTKIIERNGEFFYPAPGITFRLLTQKKAYSKTVE